MMPNDTLLTVAERIRARSIESRGLYLDRLRRAANAGPRRENLSCGNLAHGFAACPLADKRALKAGTGPNIAIVSAYSDMLSAHQPFEGYPKIIKEAAREVGAVAQFAGGVPAMCDGITQGRRGMELSLFSREVIAMATVVALSHDMFDAALMLGVCDKIVPGLVMGALAFGHLPTIFTPAGPMTSGLPNAEKARVRQLHAEGKVGRTELLEAENRSYHGPGTCTFYGTANTNQMLMEIMGLHLPGASFVNPGTPLRDALTKAATRRVTEIATPGRAHAPIGELFSERTLVNGIVGLLATGGSTNHTLHLVAMAAAAGHCVTWDDFAALSKVVPSLVRVYPNGLADVNHFHAAGGMAFLIRTLLNSGLLDGSVRTVVGEELAGYTREPILADGVLTWRDGPTETLDRTVLRPADDPFSPDSGLRILSGNLGRAVIKVSAVRLEHRVVEAPARVFHDQDELVELFKRGELDRDLVAVVRFQGPRANGMPELHKLTPSLAVLQDRGFKVALVTDGRMSGASGKVPAAIHVSPEALTGGPLARLRDGDIVRLDPDAGVLEAQIPAEELATRSPATVDLSGSHSGMGRELFAPFRTAVSGSEGGATVFPFFEDVPA